MSIFTSTKAWFSGASINRKTFEEAYKQYWENVYAVCYNNIRDSELAKEMVQDIFKSLWERRESLELRNIEHYLIRSAKLKTFEHLRNRATRQRLDEENMQNCAVSGNCTEERVLFNDLKGNVELLVDSLPCQCKRVYKMSREDGLSNKEIAGMLSITERAVEYHISKALGVLKSGLNMFQR